VDFRLIAAANVALEDEVAAGRFREDLFYRLNVFPIHVPSLRERGADVGLLAHHFRLRAARENGIEPPDIPPETIRRMMEYPWPGNVRELENFVERAVILHAGAATLPFDPPRKGAEVGEGSLLEEAVGARWTLERLEREYVLRILREVGGNQVRAAETLGIDRRTLTRKLKQYRDEGGAAKT
jgi:DNA-binding NtrC family response regulator